MKILIFNFEYPPLGGGGGGATQQIAEELARRHDVHVITSQYIGLERREVKDRLVIHRVRVPGRQRMEAATLFSMLMYVPAAWWYGWRLLRQTHFDVINAQFVVPSGVPAALLARWFRIPFVLSFIGGDVYDPTKGTSPHRHWWLRVLIRLIARQATACTAISEDTKQRAVTLHGVKQPITVTHLGVVLREPAAVSRTALGLPDGVPLFVSVGRLIPRKGYEVLLEAWQHVPRAALVIVGSGPLAEKLRDLAQQHGIADRVFFTGWLAEERKWEVLSSADGFVSAAEHEGFGLVFLEAMAAGLPIVATTVGGQCDFLTEGQNARLVPPRDSEAMAQAIQELIHDQGLRQRLRDANKVAVHNFTVAKTTKEFEEVLLTALRRFQDRAHLAPADTGISRS